MILNMSSNQGIVTGTSHWMSGVERLLVFRPHASNKLFKKIGWLRTDFPDNRNEQGGILIGRYIKNAEGIPVQAEVLEILVAKTESRFPGYIEWDAMEEIRLQRQFFDIKEKLEFSDSELENEVSIIGWWHTHPNGLPVFMSGTDMETQRQKYFKPEKYSVVLNPHRGIWRAFAGRDAVEVPAIMLLGNESDNTGRTSSNKAQKKKKGNKNKKKANHSKKSKKRK